MDKWLASDMVTFEREFKKVMEQIFWDEFIYGTSMTKIEDGKMRRIAPFSEEWNKLKGVKEE